MTRDQPILRYSRAEQQQRMKDFDRWAARARKAWRQGYAVALVSIQDYFDGKPVADAIFGKEKST